MKPDYGLDAPKLVRRLAGRAAMVMAFAVLLYFANRNTNAQAARTVATLVFSIGMILAVVAGTMVLSSRVVKLKVIDRMLDSLPWRGDEKVLDVGCGRGAFLIGAAKRLTTGKATGIDIWQSNELSNNTAEAALANAKAEGVAGRVKIETADARKLPYAAASFDVVLSSLAIHNIRPREERATALNEIARVLKPGGYLAIFDILNTGEYAKVLEQLDFRDIRLSPMTFLWCVPTRSLTARKA
ncbi:MAG: class I SAM-dependent methyltransferase [Bryobacteraceae bacterium]|jgi:SAM-dependent methyltransferase